MDNQALIDLLRAPFGATGPAELPEGTLQGQVGAKAVTGAGNGATNLVKNLVDASKTDADYYAQNGFGQDYVPQTVGPAAQMAMALAGTGAPMAEAGAAGIFGGNLAKTADLKALLEARKMEMSGLDRDEIIKNTGWFRSPTDNRWRFEIPDDKMRIHHFPRQEGANVIGDAAAIIEHPELYKAYPSLQFGKTGIVNDGRFPNGNGYFQGGKIGIAAPNVEVARSVAAHELQHGVQNIQNFQFGADPSDYARLIETGLKKKPQLLEGTNFHDVISQADHLYHRTAGEVEPRNVQARLNWTMPERKAVPPWYTQDVPYNEQYLRDPVTDMLKALRQK